MRIVSVPGRLVRDPVTSRVVDEVGIDIDPTDLNWARLLADGDVREETGSAQPASRSSPVTALPAARDEEPKA